MLAVEVPPAPAEREALDVRGVVTADDQRVEFSEILDVSWQTDGLRLVGTESDGTQSVTRTFDLSSLSGVLVKQLDAGKTSGIVGGLIVGAVAIVAILVGGTDPRFGN